MKTYGFNCLECKNKFTVEREEEHINELKKIFCPGCGKQWGTPTAKIEIVIDVPATLKRSSDAISKENREASNYAEEQARRDREYLNREDPEVVINGREKIRKSILDKIDKRAQDLNI